MAAKLPPDVYEAFYRVVHDYPAGVAALAAKMGLSPKVLYNKADHGTDSFNKPTLADGVVATVITGDKRVLHAFAHTVGEVCYSLPDLSSLSTDTLLVHLTQVQMRNGSFHHAIHDALSDDELIDAKEFARIEREAHSFLAVVLEGLARMREMSGGG